MQNLTLLVFILAACVIQPFAFAAEPTPTTTNTVQNASTNQTPAQAPSDAELQQAARGVMAKIIVVGVIALIGALVVAGFALYGAYQKFGVKGAVVVASSSLSE